MRSARELAAHATSETGLTDFGDPEALETLAVLIDELQRVGLSDFGRQRLEGFLFDKLCVRLRLLDMHHRHSDLAAQQISAPIFIVGLPRVGSTLLHHLFAIDHQNRVPLRWEMMQPFPPPETTTYTTDPRIALEDQALAPLAQNSPEAFAMHPMGAAFPEECMHILTGHFMSSVFMALTGCRNFDEKMRTWDLSGAYEFHRRYLQLLQWKCPGAPWVLKTPMHTGHLSAITNVYPDARFIWLHRDPAEVISSWCQLTIGMQQRHVETVDLAGAAADKVDEWHWHVTAGQQARDAWPSQDRILDVGFTDFIADPVATMNQIYGWSARTLSDDLAASMQDYVDHPPYQRGGYAKDPSRFGLDAAAVNERFAQYRMRYSDLLDT